MPLICCLALLIGCRNEEPTAPNTEKQSPTDDTSHQITPREEFLAVAEKIEDSANRYLGRNQISRLKSELEQADLDHEQTVNLQLQLCWHHLRLGEIDSAADAIDQAFAEVSKSGGRPALSMHKLKSLVYLREAEFRNCVQRHNRDCCLFPLQGGGIHSEKQPMAMAQEQLLALLARSPRNLEAAWLLNVSCMALGNFPDGVPEPYRLPPSAFESEIDLGRFVDVASEMGVDTLNLCGGAIAEDFNGDGLLDIVTSTYDPRGPLTYYRGTGDSSFSDDSARSGLNAQLGGLNCLAADYDNDGDMDILVLRGAWLDDDGQIRNSLLRNNGDGTFVDVTHAAGLAEPARPTQAAVWGDFDNDGDLDLYVGNESRVELDEPGGDFPAQLFRNNGDSTFTDVAEVAGVTNDRYCKGVTAGDYDNDGDLDIYTSNRGPNRLYRNNGGMTFTDVAADLKVMDPRQQSFACWFFDYDNDGWLDLFVAAYQSTNADVAADYLGVPHQGVSPCLYRNLGNGQFADVAGEAGLDHAYLPMGANFGDLDNDGFLDIYLTTGRPDYAALMPNVMLRNNRGQRFQDVTFSCGLGHLQKGHGVAFADIDNDGDQDIYHQLGGFYPGDKFHNALFLNPGHDNHFLTIKLVGTMSNRQATGARLRIVVKTPDGEAVFHRAVGIVSSFGGSPLRQEVGLGDATTIERIEITWPTSGVTQTLTEVPLDAFIEVTEGQAGFRELHMLKKPRRGDAKSAQGGAM